VATQKKAMSGELDSKIIVAICLEVIALASVLWWLLPRYPLWESLLFYIVFIAGIGAGIAYQIWKIFKPRSTENTRRDLKEEVK